MKTTNLPNILTIIRIILTPVFLAIFLSDIPHHFLWGLVIFSVASITDFLDGKLARKNGTITIFGQLADPVADKILTTAALLGFMQLGLCNVWIIMIVLLREFTITSFRLVATAQGIVIPANVYGKMKTISQMVFSIVIMLLAELDYCKLLGNSFPLTIAANSLLSITAILCVISGIIYVKQSIKIIDFSK